MVECIRLMNGEDLIGDIDYNSDRSTIIITNPAAILLMPSESGLSAMTLRLMKWMMFSSDRKFSIDPTQIVTIHKPTPELYNAYNAEFGNGIVIAQPDTNTKSFLAE